MPSLKNENHSGKTPEDMSINKKSKVEHYKWAEVKNFGSLQMVSKHDLVVNHEYQRDLNNKKAVDIASTFDFLIFGALTVCKLADGGFEVIDGQHRLAAAMKRSDIKEVPCIVFEEQSLERRAKSFIDVQSLRRPVTALEKFRAAVVSGDEVAVFANQVLKSVGRRPDKSRGSKTTGSKTFACIARLQKSIVIDKQAASAAVQMSHKMCPTDFIEERLFVAMFEIERLAKKDGLTILSGDLSKRILKVGPAPIISEINRQCALYGSANSATVIRRAALDVINRHLKYKFFSEEES